MIEGVSAIEMSSLNFSRASDIFFSVFLSPVSSKLSVSLRNVIELSYFIAIKISVNTRLFTLSIPRI